MEQQNHENSFWRNNVKMVVPGRPSPTKDYRMPPLPGKPPTNSFEKYQKSAEECWKLTEDELTKEYCILSDDTKLSRRPNQSLSKAHKTPIAVVHRHQASSSSSSTAALTNSATTSTANNNLETMYEDENDNKQAATQRTFQQPQRKVTPVNAKESYEYG